MESLGGFICEDSVSSAEMDSDGQDLRDSGRFYTHKRILSSSESVRANKTKCLSRNALMARENRRRKKMYLESIEREAKLLREANHQLEIRNNKNNKTINSLKKEIDYLKNVLANGSNIEKLLAGINKALNPRVIVKAEPETNQRLVSPLLGDPLLSAPTSSTLSRTQHSERSNQESLQEDELPQVGICLHLNNGHLSLGLCPLCNSSSMDSGLFL